MFFTDRSSCGVQQPSERLSSPLLGTHCSSPWHEEGARKVVLNIACSTPPYAVSSYIPTITNPDEVKNKFYEDLNDVITTVPNADKLIALSDFNARIGCNSTIREGVIGKHGIGSCNSNGLVLLQTCTEHDLLITNTTFRLPTCNRTSWMHSRSKHWHLIDYVIIRKRDR